VSRFAEIFNLHKTLAMIKDIDNQAFTTPEIGAFPCSRLQ